MELHIDFCTRPSLLFLNRSARLATRTLSCTRLLFYCAVLLPRLCFVVLVRGRGGLHKEQRRSMLLVQGHKTRHRDLESDSEFLDVSRNTNDHHVKMSCTSRSFDTALLARRVFGKELRKHICKSHEVLSTITRCLAAVVGALCETRRIMLLRIVGKRKGMTLSDISGVCSVLLSTPLFCCMRQSTRVPPRMQELCPKSTTAWYANPSSFLRR